MTKTSAITGLLTVVALLAGSMAVSHAQSRQVTPAAGGKVTASKSPGDETRRIISIPSPDRRAPMRTLVLRPKGAGPFPLVLINHGSTQNAARRAAMTMPQYTALAQWFLARGYVVALPLRPGHGKTGGPYLEDQKGCARADFRNAGLATADSIETALRYMTAQPDVKRTGVVVVGQSAGGWGAVALGSRNPAGVSAVVSFAGGRGGRSNEKADTNCAPNLLVDAAGSFGRGARVPTLWIYAENDSYFGPALSRRMVDAYRAAGGIAEYRLLPPYGADGHTLIEMREGAKLWGPLIGNFLDKLK
jgi:dienelactone hydrolase